MRYETLRCSLRTPGPGDALVIAFPAGAVKPQCDDTLPGYTPKHPSCNKDDPADETPIGATVCDPAEYPPGIEGVQEYDFDFTLSGKQAGACIDVISKEGPWKVTIGGHGARQLGIIPRDSSGPGDSCGGYLLRSKAIIYGSNPLTLGYEGVIPAATINACGTQYGEWVDIGLDGLDPTLVTEGGDCAVIEEGLCFVTEQVDVTQPLVLLAFLGGSADGLTTFHVDLPGVDLPPSD